MNPRQVLLAVSLCLLGLSLTSGYYRISNGIALSGLSILAWLAYWWFAQQVSVSAFASSVPAVCLFASVGLAVSGLLLGAPAFLMMVAAALSLAAWDLLALDVALAGQTIGEQGRCYETRHLHSLGMAIGSGLLLSYGARLISIRVPFAVLLLLVAAAVFVLDRLWAAIATRRSA